MSENVWCEHINNKRKAVGWSGWAIEKEFLTLNGKPASDLIWVYDQVKDCPICGAPRPELRKGLGQKLHDTYYKTDDALMEGSTQYEWWNQVATCAFEHFVAIVDEVGQVTIGQLKKAMRDSLNG